MFLLLACTIAIFLYFLYLRTPRNLKVFDWNPPVQYGVIASVFGIGQVIFITASLLESFRLEDLNIPGDSDEFAWWARGCLIFGNVCFWLLYSNLTAHLRLP